MSIRKAIARNTAFNAGGRLWEFAAGILLTAYIVRRIGAAEYGAWALVAPFVGYIALLDIGLSAGFARHVADRAAKRDDAGLSAVVSTGFFYYLAAGAAVIAAGWFCIGAGMAALASRGLAAEATAADLAFLFRGGLILLVASNAFAAFTAVQTGLQRMDVTNLLSAAASLVKIAATVAFVESGLGVRGLLYAEGISTAVFGIASAAAAFRLRPGLRVGPGRASGAVFRELFAFGWRSQVARLSNLVMFQTDKLLTGAYGAFTGTAAPLALVGQYDLGASMAGKLRTGPAILTSALLPAAAHLDALAHRERLGELYVRSTKYLAAAAIPALAFGAANGQAIMAAWMGPGFETAGWVLTIMAVGYVANIVPGAGVSIVLGMGRADLVMGAGLVSMAANLALTVALMAALGFWGIPLATVLSMAISWIWFAGRLRPLLGIGLGTLAAATMAMPALACVPGVAASLWVAAFTDLHPLLLVSINAALFGASYLAALSLLPYFDGRDLSLLRSAAPFERIPFAAEWLAFACARGGAGAKLRAFAHGRGRGYPDWAARYRPVVRRMERMIVRETPLLEIGANENGYSRFSGRRVVAVDIAMDHLRAARRTQDVLPVAADITALPFRDGAFGGVACIDTFEHLPAPSRRGALTEIHRVLASGGAAAIGFPSGPAAAAAEARVREAYRAYTGGTIRWLDEHAEHGLPDGETIAAEAVAASGGARRVRTEGNLNVAVWERMWRIMMCGWPGRGNALAQAALHVATPLVVRRHGAPCYRTIVWLEPRDE